MILGPVCCLGWELPPLLWPPWWSKRAIGAQVWCLSGTLSIYLCSYFSVWDSVECSCLLSYSFFAIKTQSLFIFLLSSLALVLLFLNCWRVVQVWTSMQSTYHLLGGFEPCLIFSCTGKLRFQTVEMFPCNFVILLKKIIFLNSDFFRQQGRFWMLFCRRLVLHLKTLLMCKIFIMKVTQLHGYLSLELFPFEWLFSPHRWGTSTSPLRTSKSRTILHLSLCSPSPTLPPPVCTSLPLLSLCHFSRGF